MTQAEQESLRAADVLFGEPTSTCRLAAGFGRGWPDARGVYATKARDLFIWCNEEDHFRIIAVQNGGDLQAVVARAKKCAQLLDDEIKLEEIEISLETFRPSGFAWDGRLGFITTSPENLGSGLSATVTLQLALLGKQPDFQRVCDKLQLRTQWRGSAG